MAEKRKDTDGNFYSKDEFISCYGDTVKWEAAEARICPVSGVALTKRDFISNYGGLGEWSVATPEFEEKRVDPADGEMYTKQEFLSCYKSDAQWERAKDEHRIDSTDGKAYTKRDFLACYGGRLTEWEAALPVSSRSKKKSVSPPEDPPVSKEPERASPPPRAEPTPEPIAVPAPVPEDPLLPGKKTARRVVSLDQQMRMLAKVEEEDMPRTQSASSASSAVASPKVAAAVIPTSPTSMFTSMLPAQFASANQNELLKKAIAKGGVTNTAGLDLENAVPQEELVVETTPCSAREMPTGKLTEKFSRSMLTAVVVGHVDAGKSTLMGHLLYALGEVPQRTLHKFEKESKAMGKASFHYAWVLDETEEERERGVTMDIATAYVTLPTKRVTILDAPGHAAFQGNTCLGASQADASIIVVNAVNGEFETGLERGQTKEAIYILRGSGITHLVVAVNKMDTVDFSQTRFEEITAKIGAFLQATGFKPANVVYIPVSGLTGANIVERGEERLGWYSGATLVEALDNLPNFKRQSKGMPLRMSVSDTLKGGIAGTIQTGEVSCGSKVVILPGNVTGTVKAIERHRTSVDTARAGDNVELSFPAALDVSQVGMGMAVASADLPCKVCRFIEMTLLNISEATRIVKSFTFVAHIQTAVVEGKIKRFVPLQGKCAKIISPGKTGAVLVALSEPTCVELSSEFRGFGRVILRAGGTTVAMGTVTKVFPE